ncbi:MAG: glycoside hydrolase family 29 [Luteitalea sp.]|nr:glycoside hydrolase family 29 [Luteitalea sp.]
MTIRPISCLVCAWMLATGLSGRPTGGPPAPVQPVPTGAQVAWQRLELNAFVHFGPNAFTGAEWGTGREDPGVFNPSQLDAGQWARVFKNAGFKGVVITAKHHDGFCLWPSKLSTHTVAQSPWRGGRGDLLRELSDACRAAGLRFGVYLSPWDRHHPTYGTPQYNGVFADMLEEVLSSYGPIFEVWFDGANGEGPNGKRQIYDWNLFQSTVRRLQPSAVMFSDSGPDVRWVGNERGEAPLTAWSLLDRSRYFPGTPLSHELGEGSRFGRDWVPPECDVSIRPGWFHRSSEDERVKSSRRLLEIYEASVGRNCTLLLNVPPDRRGRIADPDIAALEGFRQLLDATYGLDLASGARVEADAVRGAAFAPANVVDQDVDTYWAAPDGVVRASVTLTLPEARRFDRVVLQEYIPLGQRVDGFLIEAKVGESWERIGFGTTIGHKRIVTVPPTTTRQVRIILDEARACPTLASISLHRSQIRGAG